MRIKDVPHSPPTRRPPRSATIRYAILVLTALAACGTLPVGVNAADPPPPARPAPPPVSPSAPAPEYSPPHREDEPPAVGEEPAPGSSERRDGGSGQPYGGGCPYRDRKLELIV